MNIYLEVRRHTTVIGGFSMLSKTRLVIIPSSTTFAGLRGIAKSPQMDLDVHSML
jgi:hypothetical protein